MNFGQKISGKRAQKLAASGAVLIDVRGAVEYRDDPIRGFVNLPLRRISEVLRYPKTTKLILMGNGHDDQDLKAAVQYIAQYGFTDTFVVGGPSDYRR